MAELARHGSVEPVRSSRALEPGGWPAAATAGSGRCALSPEQSDRAHHVGQGPADEGARSPGGADTAAPDRVQAGPRLNALLEEYFEEPSLVMVCENGMTLAEARLPGLRPKSVPGS